MRIYAVWLLVALAAFMGTAHSQEIVDLYSSIESADATVVGDASGSVLRLDLIYKGDVLQTRNLALDGPGTWITRWTGFNAEEGSYDVCASLWKNNTEGSRRCYNFFYGGPTPVRFDVRDFYADSKGMHLSISGRDPTIVDIYYMLISGDKALYVSRDRAVPISGGLAAPTQIDYAWKQILENNKGYTGRVKIVELNYNQTRAFMNSFTARDDAQITETYEDEIGASATVLGNSRVPFEGTLRFELSQNGTPLQMVERKTPVLLTGDDETVEITWNRTLDPGVYQLSIVLLGNDGDIRDIAESIIEAEPVSRPVNNATAEAPAQESPLPAAAGLIALAVAAMIGKRRDKSP
jgi:hypothetical protein